MRKILIILISLLVISLIVGCAPKEEVEVSEEVVPAEEVDITSTPTLTKSGWEYVATPIELKSSAGQCAFTNFGDKIYVGSTMRIYSSSNGITWEEVTTASEVGGTSRRSLKSFENYLYAGGYSKGIFRTSNGINWEKIATSEELGQIRTFGNFKNYLYAGGVQGISKSSDGKTWENVDAKEIIKFKQPGGTFREADESLLYVSNFIVFGNFLYARASAFNAAIFRSSDGTIWEQMKGPPGDLIKFKDHLYSGSDQGIYMSPDGEKWEQVATADEVGNIQAIGIFGNQLYIGSRSKGIFRSSDSTTWEQVAEGMEVGGICGFGVFGNHLYAGSNMGIFRTTGEIISVKKKEEVKVPTDAKECGTDESCFCDALEKCEPVKFKIRNEDFGVLEMDYTIFGGTTAACKVRTDIIEYEMDPKQEGMYMVCDQELDSRFLRDCPNLIFNIEVCEGTWADYLGKLLGVR